MRPLARAAVAAFTTPSLPVVSKVASASSISRTLGIPRPWAPHSGLSANRTFFNSPVCRIQPPKSHEPKPEADTDVSKPIETHLRPELQINLEGSPTSTNPQSTNPEEKAGSTTTGQAASPTGSKYSTSAPESDIPPTVDSAAESSKSQTFPFSPAALSSHPLLTTSLPRLIDTLQARLLTASQTLNDLTGYTSIERIKTQNTNLETRLETAHATLRHARTAYKTCTSLRATTQREVTTLLARKETWTPPDVERFTELYRKDHTLEQEVAASAERLNEAEADEQRLSQELMAGMLRRYHEEQIWSDRIRRASTWGTWGLMGINVVLFVLLQFVAEPWRRRRLVRAVVEEEKTVLQSVREELAAVRDALALVTSDGTGAQVLETTVAEGLVADELSVNSAAEPLTGPTEAQGSVEAASVGVVDDGRAVPMGVWTDLEHWRTKAADLYSDRRINLSMRDASLLALQAAAAGATLAGSVAFLFLKA